MPPSIKTAARYAAFAAMAIIVNVAVQVLCFALYDGRGGLYAAMAAGTVAGLVAKYFLDRRWIFRAAHILLRGRVVEFALYSLTGALTTCLFWATELAFAAMSDSPLLRYTGAVLGLVAGYAIKFRIDRRFVFREGGAAQCVPDRAGPLSNAAWRGHGAEATRPASSPVRAQ